MEKKVKNIIDELLTLEPSLKGKEDELKKVIEAMIHIKPEIDLSPDFRDNLKKKLEAQISSKVYTKKVSFDYSVVSKFIGTFMAGGALVASVFIFGIMPNSFTPLQDGSDLAFESDEVSTFAEKSVVKSVSPSSDNSIEKMVGDALMEAKRSIVADESVEESMPMLNSIMKEEYEVQNGEITYVFDGVFEIPKTGIIYEMEIKDYPFVETVAKNEFKVTLTKEKILEEIRKVKEINYGGDDFEVKLKNPVVKLVKEGNNIVTSLVFFAEKDVKKGAPYHKNYITIPLNRK